MGKYKKVEITPEITMWAKQKADYFGKNPYTWRKRPGRLVGFIGEATSMAWLSQYGIVEEAPREDRNDYDIMFKGLKIDVKTKERDYIPRDYFEMSVGTHGMGPTQQCDVYLGVSVNPKIQYKEAWLVGYLSKSDFFEKATFYKSEGDDSQIPTDRYNVEFKDLNPMDELVKDE